jgi:hypothetical protein
VVVVSELLLVVALMEELVELVLCSSIVLRRVYIGHVPSSCGPCKLIEYHNSAYRPTHLAGLFSASQASIFLRFSIASGRLLGASEPTTNSK